MAHTALHPKRSSPPTRRDFLYIATASVGAIGAAATLVPLIDQMNPDAGTLAAGGPVDLDLSKVEPGQQVVVRWRSRPIFVINRPQKALDELKSQALQDRLADPQSQETRQAALRKKLAPLGQARIRRAGRHLHSPRLHPDILSAAECEPARGRLAGRLFLPVPRLQIRPRRTRFQRRSGALQPASTALSLRQRQSNPHRREPQRRRVRLCLDPADLDGLALLPRRPKFATCWATHRLFWV